MDVLSMATDGTVKLEPECSKQPLEVTKADHRGRVGEKLSVEFGGLVHGNTLLPRASGL